MNHTLTLSDKQTRDFEYFKRRIQRKVGLDLNQYKQQQMHRRLLGLVERAGVDSFADYYSLIERDAAQMGLFMDRLTINVSELFRNPEQWQLVQENVLEPEIRLRRSLRIWSAGCSFGAEPYSLAMLLDDLGPRAKHYLLATDIDATILRRAQKGHFTETDVKNVPAELRRRYLAQRGSDLEVAAAARDRVTFKRHNLLADDFEGDFDLILCRNVVIYFNDEAKDILFARFAKALRPGGHLFVGGTERIPNVKDLGLEPAYPFIYRRTE